MSILTFSFLHCIYTTILFYSFINGHLCGCMCGFEYFHNYLHLFTFLNFRRKTVYVDIFISLGFTVLFQILKINLIMFFILFYYTCLIYFSIQWREFIVYRFISCLKNWNDIYFTCVYVCICMLILRKNFIN